jgi:acetate kinase
MTASVLTINGGSSSIKCALYTTGDSPKRIASGKVERVGTSESLLQVVEADGKPQRRPVAAQTHEQALNHFCSWLSERRLQDEIIAVGHRIVHGGPNYFETQRITPEVICELQRLSPLDPEHLPAEIALVQASQQRFPQVPQFACFDTAFHHDLPRVAQLLPIPRQYESQGIRRYGFHGLSYAFLTQELERIAGTEAARGRVILAHLGNGASMAAVRAGKCLETTMGLTPTAGLVMGTRTGDLDPGLLIHFMRDEHMDAEQIDHLVNHQAGLLGVSGISADMRDLMARQANEVPAAEAVSLFCYHARKWVGALATVLGGIDTLVFSAGIGENAPEVRARICEGLEFLGIHLDHDQNDSGAAVISTPQSPCTVRVIRTDEELMILREVQRRLGESHALPK